VDTKVSLLPGLLMSIETVGDLAKCNLVRDRQEMRDSMIIYFIMVHITPDYRDTPSPGDKMMRKIDNLGEIYAMFGDRVGNNYQWNPTADRLYLVNIVWSKLYSYDQNRQPVGLDDPIQENRLQTYLMEKALGPLQEVAFFTHSRWDGYKEINMFGNKTGMYLKDLDPMSDKVMIAMKADNSGRDSIDARKYFGLPMNQPMVTSYNETMNLPKY